MPDRDRVIYDIERCICHVPDACRDCSKFNTVGGNCTEDLLSDALALLKEQETFDGWISVKDRLPEDETEVIIFVQHKIGWYRVFGWHDEYGWHSSAEEFGDGESDFVTHWMPLPEPPEEVSGDV